ncbi:MAG: hypothetical protein CMJ78_21420 [Planctomycetaceae bacterium]|nr:hypothetical protein [Planctomycetaceae bacterium]
MLSYFTQTLAATTFELGPQRTPGWMMFLIIVMVVVLPFIIGPFIAKAFKAKEYSNRISTILLSLFLAITPFAYQVFKGNVEQSAYNAKLHEANTKNEAYKITDEGVEKIEEAMPNVTVQR